MPYEVAVIGGGLSGISCALELGTAGRKVVLVERAPVLGGLCRSVADPLAGRVDTGQHVYLGCCTALQRFLGRVGARPAVRQPRLELHVCLPSGRSRRVAAGPGPAPLHLLPVLWRWPGISSRTFAAMAGLQRQLSLLGPEQLRELDSVPALGWLRSLGQDERTIRRFWEPVLVAACNVGLERCSAGVAAFVIAEGFLSTPEAGALRIPATDLTGWLDPPSRSALEERGVEIRTRWRVASIDPGGKSGFLLTEPDGESISAESLVLAVPAAAAARLLGQERCPPQLRRAALLPSSPIVNVHLFTDRPFLPGPVTVVPQSPLQWLFDRSELGEDQLTQDGRPVFHSAISISAADHEVRVGELALGRHLWDLCQQVFPAAERARLRHLRVTREAAATFAALPGSAGARPAAGPLPGAPGIYLSGNWTATGWPATMEGAVRSGVATAAEVLAG